MAVVILAGIFSFDPTEEKGRESAGRTFFPGVLVVSATSTTQQQIKDGEQRRDELAEEKDKNEDELATLQGEQKNLEKVLKNQNEQLNQVVANLESLEQQITNKVQEIANTQEALEEAKETERWQYECMVERVRTLYETEDDSYLNALLRESSLSDVLNTADYVERVAAYERKKMEEYKATRIYIEEKEARLQDEKLELDGLKAQAEEEKSKVIGLIQKTSNSVAACKDQIADAEERAKELEAQIKKEEENLEYLRKKLEEEIALSRAAASAAWRDISEVSFDAGDRKLLANLIYCEAGGEPYEGKLAVGSVVINRVLSSKYASTVVGVIYQKKQFSPAASGRLDLALGVDSANADCYRAADEAMSGVTNVGSCLYFRTPIPELEQLVSEGRGVRIGGHIFY